MGLFDIFKSKKEIKEALNDPSNPLNNQSYEPTENKSKYTETPFGNFTVEDRLFMIAKGGIVELKQAYKDLTDEGKFEVILFNSVIALWSFGTNHSEEEYPINQNRYMEFLINQAETYNIKKDTRSLIIFITKRYEFYANQFGQFSDPHFTGSKIYSSFYVSPLSDEVEPSFDLTEIMKFKMCLFNMIKWIKENADNI